MNAEIWKNSFLQHFEQRLLKILAFDLDDSQFLSAVNYQFFPAGKRIRPLIMAAFAQDLGIAPKAILDLSCAVEILHTASLIHDDLPELDNDFERRGRATLHVAAGQGTALLTGDYLIARAFECVAQSCASDPKNAARLNAALGKGFRKVCLGQELDIRNASPSRDDSLALYDFKTGALFHCGLELVRIVRYSGDELQEALGTFAKDLGRSFQVLNDLKDFEPSSSGLAERSSNSDMRNQRPTAVHFVVERERKAFVEALLRKTWKSYGDLCAELSSLQGSLAVDHQASSLARLKDVLENVIMLAV